MRPAEAKAQAACEGKMPYGSDDEIEKAEKGRKKEDLVFDDVFCG